MRSVRLSAEHWPGVVASCADTFQDRLLGIRARDSKSAVLLATRSVHSFGLNTPLRLVGLDKGMRVVGTRRLRPNRIAYISGASFILELDEDTTAPRTGTRVEVSDV